MKLVLFPGAMRRPSFIAFALCALGLVACPGKAPDPNDPSSPSPRGSGGPCNGLDQAQCGRAQGLLRAASGFGNVHHEYLLDPASAMTPGRGVQKSPEGGYDVLPTKCALERHGSAAAGGAPRVDASTIDFSYVGVAIDQTLVSADADLAPWLSAGAEGSLKKISLVAIAFVRDLDPQFFGASEDVAFASDACTCGRATHFIGSVKMGGLVSYEMNVKAGELRGSALDFVKARFAASDARITQTVVGGLEVDGLEAVTGVPKGGAPLSAKPLAFRVKNPVPIAYAIYPLADVCKFAFPVPDVSPELVDFGDVPYDKEETRYLHVVNRAAIDLRATIGERTFAVPALGSVDVPIGWRPQGETSGCEVQTREDTLHFFPTDAQVPVTPKSQTVKITERVRTGKPTWTRTERIDTGVHRKPDYAATARDWTCPADYALSSCRTEKSECGDGKCTTDGYAVNAEPGGGGNGCRFSCRGPEGLLPGISSNFCRFDARMECRLRCR